MDIGEVLLLRRAHSLGLAVVDENGNLRHDSDLPASQLSQKLKFHAKDNQKSIEMAHALYKKVVDKKKHPELESAVSVWVRLFGPGDKNGTTTATTTTNAMTATTTMTANGDSSPTTTKQSPLKNHVTTDPNFVDTTLFFGLESFLGKEEQLYVTQLLTSGERSKLAQAAMILHGILKINAGAQAQSTVAKLSFQQLQRESEKKEKVKKAFPLPNHMPGYVVLPNFTPSQGFAKFVDLTWDGKIIGPAKSKIFDKVYGDYVLPKEPRKVVTIKAVRGPAGRVGLRTADVVTHVNDEEWSGTAEELASYIHQLYKESPNSEFTMTVNANTETAKFLQLRHRLLMKSRVDLI